MAEETVMETCRFEVARLWRQGNRESLSGVEEAVFNYYESAYNSCGLCSGSSILKSQKYSIL